MIRRIVAVALKEFFHLSRDRSTLAALLLMPAILLLIYGFALSFDVEHVRVGVVDQDQSPLSRKLTASFVTGTTFDLTITSADIRDLQDWFDRSLVQAALVIPSDYEKKILRGEQTSVQFVVDGSDSRTATTVLAYGDLLVRKSSPLVYRPQGHGSISPTPLVWYNPNLRSSLFLVPGLLAFILMITAVVATALSVVREKELGSLETLRATPLRAGELILGKTFAYLVLAILASGLELLVAHTLFAVPLRGSSMWLLVITLLFALGGLGWGVFISTVADTQQVAFQMGLLTTLLPTLLLSGFIFPISSMPKFIQAVTFFIPARYYLVALRGILLKGTDPALWWDQVLALAIFAVGLLTLAALRIRRVF